MEHSHDCELRLDEDDYGGLGPLLTEGMAPSISVFMVRLYNIALRSGQGHKEMVASWNKYPGVCCMILVCCCSLHGSQSTVLSITDDAPRPLAIQKLMRKFNE